MDLAWRPKMPKQRDGGFDLAVISGTGLAAFDSLF